MAPHVLGQAADRVHAVRCTRLVATLEHAEKRLHTTSGDNVGATALAGTKLGDALTDLAFGWTATVRPLQEITIGQPDLLSKDGYKESFSGLGTRKGGML